MTLQELLLLVFCLVDDEVKAPDLAHLRQRGSQPLLHDSGVITIELVGELHGRDRDARLFRHFRHEVEDRITQYRARKGVYAGAKVAAE